MASALVPIPPRGLEPPLGTWLPAKPYPPASAPSPASLVPHQSVLMSAAPRAWVFQASPEWPCCPPADPASQTPEPQQANPHFSPNPAWHPGALALRARRFWAHHLHAPLATFAHREVGSEGASGPLLLGGWAGCVTTHVQGSLPTTAAWRKGMWCVSRVRLLQQAGTQVHWPPRSGPMHCPTCLVTNTPVPKRGRRTRFQGLLRQSHQPHPSALNQTSSCPWRIWLGPRFTEKTAVSQWRETAFWEVTQCESGYLIPLSLSFSICQQ